MGARGRRGGLGVGRGGGQQREQEGEETVEAGEDGRLEAGGLVGIPGQGGAHVAQYGCEVVGGECAGRGALGDVAHIC